MGEGCRTFFRVILGILTVLFLLIGILMLAFGVALKVKPIEVLGTVTTAFTDILKDQSSAAGDLKSILQSATDGVAIFMIVLGCITVAISILGLAGTISGSKAVLAIYATIMILILGAEIALIVLVAAFPDKIQSTMTTVVPQNYSTQDVTFVADRYVIPPSELGGLFWYLIQNYFGCCGLSSYKDYSNVSPNKPTVWANSTYYGTGLTLVYPTSCCKKISEKQAVFNSTTQLTNFASCATGSLDSVNTLGCAQKLFDGSSTIPIAVAAATLGLEVLLIICAIVVAALRRSKSYV